MLFSRYAVARLLATAALIAPVANGTQSLAVARSSAPQSGKPSAARPSPQAAASAALSGTVRAAGSQNPVARARVTVNSESLSVPRVAITGPDGRYAFEKLPAGSYTVQASASGFAPQYHGQRPTGAPGAVRVSQAQRVSQIDIDLPAAGVIVGRILDEDQRPFVGASVDALVPRVERQQATLVSMASAVTDDRGEFRLAGLPAGEYYVSAFDPAFAEVGDESGPLRYTATYYPGVVLLEEARRVSVTPGSDPKGSVVFPLKIVRPARVSGLIATGDRRQLLSGAVIMAPVHGEGLSAVPSEDVRIDPDGRFVFRNVAPGRYQIFARAQADAQGVALFATYRLLVDGRDIDHLDLALRPGATIRGAVAFDAREHRPPRGLTGLRVRAPFPDGSLFGDAHTGDVDADGRFTIRGVMAGAHYITVEGLQEPWVLKDVQWRGEDVTDRALDLNAKDVVDGVRITVTDIAHEVKGTVKDSHGRPVSEALVLIVPLTPQYWTPASRRFAGVRTDGEGRYRVRGLPAGEYRAIASVELDEGQVYRRDVLQALTENGQRLTLDSPRLHLLDLGLTSLASSKTPGL